MYLFQYWDRKPIPQDVASWIDDCRNQNPDLEHVLLDHADARRFIERHFTYRECAAFASCGPPAMQADYLRLCLMFAVGGLYVDADQAPREEFSQLLKQADRGLIVQWLTILNNCPIFMREPGNEYIRACLDLATGNIIERRFEHVLTSTGPGVLSAVWGLLDQTAGANMEAVVPSVWGPIGWNALLSAARALIIPSAALIRDLNGLTRITTDESMRWLGLTNPVYKTGDRHWNNWSRSIYDVDTYE